ncbi:MAG: methionyl-tRNA formyltransferase [Geminicoccaceae bacterium]|nr:methionyl-tRNA formyltransferase [Geminicoccaceae bacterium]
MRVAFLGSSAFAVPALEALIACGVDVPAVYTRPPRPADRAHKIKRTPVHETAELRGLEVRAPVGLRDAAEQARFAELDLDLALVASYGLLLPEPILHAPRHGCVNIHASLLPRWRGASPIQQAIMAGDDLTGVSFFQMEKGLDTGPVLLERATPIGSDETAGELHDRLALVAADLVPEFLGALAAHTLVRQQQDDAGVTYAPKIGKDDARIDWRRPADEIERRVRAFEPQPGAWTLVEGKRLRVRAAHVVEGLEHQGAAPGTVVAMPLVVACGAHALALDRVQREGRKPMAADELQRGTPIPLGGRLDVATDGA